MKKRFLVAMLTMACLVTTISGSISHAASQKLEITDSGVGVSDTLFQVTPEMLGGGLLVTVPDKISLSYDSTEKKFTKTSVVNAKGYITVGKCLKVSVPTSITYIMEKAEDSTATGTISFGVADDTNQVTTWSINELTVKDSGSLIGTNKNITVDVPETEVNDIGIYDSIINFTISLENS